MNFTAKWKIESVEKGDELNTDNVIMAELGYDPDTNKEYFVTAGEGYLSNAESSPKKMALLIRNAPRMYKLLEKVAKQVKPRLVFGEKNQILDLLEEVNKVLDKEDRPSFEDLNKSV